MMDKMIKAGIDAIAAFTMNTTIDQKGILISTMLTSFALLFSIRFSINNFAQRKAKGRAAHGR
jgi:S-methylmethionine-dependent homocysteine/selenocysteine methylase